MQNPNRTQSMTASPTLDDSSILKSVLDNAVDGLVVLNTYRQVVYMNKAAANLIGERSVGMHCGALLHCHDANHNSLRANGCYGECVLSSGQALTNVEMNIRDKSGKTIPVEVSYSYIPVADSAPYLLMSLRDVTDKKAAESARRQKEELRYTLQERERLARDLHDGVVQDIAFVNMQVKLALDDLDSGTEVTREQLAKISHVLDSGYSELRTAIRDLSLGISGNLSHHLSQSVLEFRGRTNIEVGLECDQLPHDLETSFVDQVTKIVQEALTNIRKHAQATKASVSVRFSEPARALIVDVIDNGVGFSISEKHKAGHFGMKTMYERCELLGGQLQLDSAPNEGTQVHCELPLT